MDIQRKAFEESNNVNPDWSFKFDEELQQYVATDFEMTNQVDEFNEHWDTFRAGWDAKAQAVPEGFVLVEKAKLMQIVGSAAIIEPITRGNPLMSKYKTELDFILSTVRAMIEAQEQKITLLKVEWASDCFECGHHEAIIYSTASEASTKGWFHDGDAVKCCKCGHTGEMDARGEDSDICWNEEPTND